MRECRTCMSWQPNGELGSSGTYGECRAYPPDTGGLTEQKWPLTFPHDWCSSHTEIKDKSLPVNNGMIITTAGMKS